MLKFKALFTFRLFSIVLGSGLTGWALIAQAADAPAIPSSSPILLRLSESREAQRQDYLKAERMLANRQFTSFKKQLSRIEDYPLTPYLVYEELHRRLHLRPYDEVDAFLDAQAGSYLGDQLARHWLLTLAEQKRWHEYRSYYRSLADSVSRVPGRYTELDCQYLWSRISTGDDSAYGEVASLWNVGRSQPNDCDPLFEAWIDAGYLTPEIAWQRFSKAMDANNRRLARYLASIMPDAEQKRALLYQDVHNNPALLKNYQRFSDNDPRTQAIILHGIRRYARRDPLQALTHWEKYDASHLFAEQQRQATQEVLLSQLMRRGHRDKVEQMMRQSPSLANANLAGRLARTALRQQDWQKLYDTLQLLPEQEQQSERWLYWRARALEQLDITDPDYPAPEQIYLGLSLTRTFYGFMAADILDTDYTLLNRPVDAPLSAVEQLARQPAVQRAGEFLMLGRLYQARREWFYITRELPPPQVMAAGKLAEQWGWHRQSIQAMINIRHWDDLQLRFPLAYMNEMETAARKTRIDQTYLMAIARQESAFSPDARSSAGARGLMQLMPSTARLTARKIGVPYHYKDLIVPANNIQLGSSYLNMMLEEFGGNRVLATAAYNAGPHRVKRWLRNYDKPVPYDVWIETIPFSETRSYVQNVMAFSVIYSHRLGREAPLLTDGQRTDQALLGIPDWMSASE